MLYIDIHTHDQAALDDVLKVVNIFPWDEVKINTGPGLFYSAGIHPWYIDEMDIEVNLKKIRDWHVAGKIIAIGEAGLDTLCGAEMRKQKEVFIEQISISEESGCPMIIHCVKAYNEILSMRKASKAKQPWILHGFNSSVQMMRQMTDTGIFISLGPVLMRNKKLQQVCRELPDEKLFFETDVSGIDVKDVYLKAAGIRDVPIKALKETVAGNFNRLF